MTGPQAASYLAGTARVQGASGDQIVAATRSYPFIPPSQQLYWLGSTQAYQQTAQFLVAQGQLSSVPSAAQIAAHIDITFIKKALSSGCTS